MSQRYLVIGDVHGMISTLKRLWDSLNPKQDDIIVFLGDLVNKGEDSGAVVDFLREKHHSFNLVLLIGNHEDRLFRSAKRKGNTGGLSKENFKFLKNNLQMFFKFKSGGELFTCVHGGISTTFKEKLKNKRVEKITKEYFKTLHKVDPEKLKGYPSLFLTKNINVKNPKNFSKDNKHPFWADLYKGEHGTVLYGHTPNPEVVKEYPHAIGLDTGAALGHKLTAAIIQDGHVTFKGMQADKKYALYLLAQHYASREGLTRQERLLKIASVVF